MTITVRRRHQRQIVMKTSSLLTLVLYCVCAAERASAAQLTGVMVFSCDAAGNPAGDFIWDTRGLDSDFYKVWLTPGTPAGSPDGLTAGFINGPDWARAPINISLNEGPNPLTLFFEYNGPWPFFAVNLFFDGNTLPAISVKAPLRTNDSIPPFTANPAPRTYSMTSYPTPNAPAAGTTSALLDKTVELKAYEVAAPAVFARDRVDTHQVGASGRNDYIGAFVLDVSSARRQPRIQLHVTEVTLCWDSESNHIYQVQYRSAQTPGGWTDVGAPVTGNGGTNCVSDHLPLGEPQRFYRLVDGP